MRLNNQYIINYIFDNNKNKEVELRNNYKNDSVSFKNSGECSVLELPCYQIDPFSSINFVQHKINNNNVETNFFNLFKDNKDLSNEDAVNLALNPIKRKIIFDFLDKKIDEYIIEYENGHECIHNISKEDLFLAKETLAFLKSPSKETLPRPVVFNGINYKNSTERENCQAIIHSSAAVCGGITALVGEGTAAGLDIPFLITAETVMFSALGNELNVKPEAAVIYAAREFAAGALIGGALLKGITAIAAIAGEACSYGAAVPVITAALRATNAAISVGICEKMGWGFVSAIKNGTMNTEDQSIRAAAFAASWGVSDIFSNLDFFSDINIIDAKVINDSLSGDIKNTIADAVKYTSAHGTNSIGNRAVTCFASYLTDTSTRLVLNGKSVNTAVIKEVIKDSIIATVIGEVIAGSTQSGLEHVAKEQARFIAKDPEIYRIFNENFIEKGLLDKNRLTKSDLIKIAELADEMAPHIRKKMSQKKS